MGIVKETKEINIILTIITIKMITTKNSPHEAPGRCETSFVQVICIKNNIATGTKYLAP